MHPLKHPVPVEKRFLLSAQHEIGTRLIKHEFHETHQFLPFDLIHENYLLQAIDDEKTRPPIEQDLGQGDYIEIVHAGYIVPLTYHVT